MYVGHNFQPIDPGEVEVFGLDFKNDLAAGETIITTVWTCAVRSGVDGASASRLDGPPTVNGTISKQKISGCVDGVVYILEALVVTDAGNTLALHSHLPCAKPN